MTHEEFLSRLDHLAFLFTTDMMNQGEKELDVANVFNEQVRVRVKTLVGYQKVNVTKFVDLMLDSLEEHSLNYLGLSLDDVRDVWILATETAKRVVVGEQEYYEFRFNLYEYFRGLPVLEIKYTRVS